jgi:hypothetical protein
VTSFNYVIYIFNIVIAKRPLMVILVAILGIVIATSCITANYMLPAAYAESSVRAGCGPTQESNLSVSVTISGFSPKSLVHYKYVRSDNSLVSGGFSAGTYGKNTVAINVGPYIGIYRIYIYKDINSYNSAQPFYSSTITLPCIDKHFTSEYYKSHPQVIQYLLGIQSIYDKIKIGDYLVASSRNALNVFNLSNSNVILDQLAAQLLAAELNIDSGGVSNCIDKTISSANNLLKSQNYNGPTSFPRTTISEDLLSQMLSFKGKLEAYNHIGCT